MIDPTKSDQPMPVVNMVNIRQLLEEPLHSVLDESPNECSKGSTKTTSSCPSFPLRFGGMIFHVSHDSVTRDGDTTDERNARLAKNTD